MKHRIQFFLTSFMIGCFPLLSSCNDNDNSTPIPASQRRVNETRNFEAANKDSLFKAVITTLQDQGYNIVKVNLDSSEVTAQRDSNIILSIILYPAGTKQFAVRVNGQIFKEDNFSSTGYETINDPRFYQTEFFEPLSKSLFLQNQK